MLVLLVITDFTVEPQTGSKLGQISSLLFMKTASYRRIA